MLVESPTAIALREPNDVPDREQVRGTDMCFDPQLASTIFTLLSSVNLSTATLEIALKKLEEQYQSAVYAELIFMLSHLRFPGDVARQHWRDVLDHHQRMVSKLKVPLDIRVALVSYFLEVNRSFENPKVIEMRVFERTRASAYWDELTGLRNYRFLSEHLDQELLRSQLSGAPLSLVMIDVDDFKAFNDSFGHEAGNEALVLLAKALSGALRPSDVVARYGGEEFALVLSATPKHEARQIAEVVRRTISELPPFGDHRSLTISLGVATYPADASGVRELKRHADRALYSAKFGGKNQVRLFRESSRSYNRVASSLRGAFTMQSLDPTPMTTMKISQGGLQFSSRVHVNKGSLLEFRLEIPGEEEPVTAIGRVVRVDSEGSEAFRVAVRFVEVTSVDRTRLTAHLEAQKCHPSSHATQRAS